MKKILKIIFFISIIFYSSLIQAAEFQEGKVIIDFKDAEEYEELTFQNQLAMVLEIGRYFEVNYPNDKINENLVPDLANFFPQATQEQLTSRAEWVREGVRFYRVFNKLYTDIKSYITLPPEAPLIVADEEYDTGYSAEYIETKPDELIVIEDFKKVIAYGGKKDYQAFKAKYLRDKQETKYSFDFDKYANVLKR